MLPHEPHHRRVPLGAAKMISEPGVCFSQTVHLSCTDTNTICKRTEIKILLEPRHLGVPTGASIMIFKAYGTFGANLHLPCNDTNSLSKRI
jgi:hypothetical protein